MARSPTRHNLMSFRFPQPLAVHSPKLLNLKSLTRYTIYHKISLMKICFFPMMNNHLKVSLPESIPPIRFLTA
jgi:hypothetical protein